LVDHGRYIEGGVANPNDFNLGKIDTFAVEQASHGSHLRRVQCVLTREAQSHTVKAGRSSGSNQSFRISIQGASGSQMQGSNRHYEEDRQR
jgi:hypothetical protein